MFGFYRIAAVVPQLKVADVTFNTSEIIRCAKEAAAEGAAVVLFPELCLTGYTCGDLFHQPVLCNAAQRALDEIARTFADTNLLIAVGLPLRIGAKLYNCSALLQHGKIVGITPKTYLPNQCEFYEKRHFSSGRDLLAAPGIYDGLHVTNFFPVNEDVTIGVELCEDLWCPTPPSGELAAKGANLILNLSASNALVAKSQYRRALVSNQSARCMAVYAYTSSGVHESTTDTVFGGHAMIVENGILLVENKRFERESEIIYADVDLERLNALRIREGSFQDYPCPAPESGTAEILPLIPADDLKYRDVDPLPFVPGTAADRDVICSEIFHIQCAGLAKRMECSGAKRAVVGISGGLDSTLALLVMAETCKLLKRPASDMLTLTLPGFGTTDRTLGNAQASARLLGSELRLIDIKAACLQHFTDIGHDAEVLDTTYENVQARERTQILMDTANREQGLVVGTGDLSEIALGWSTYNADHMSMYCVNCGIPKTLVRHIVAWYADKAGGELGAVLKDIIATPVSPELLPADKDGKIAQKTESILGSYELHDFYLYHFMKYGASPAKLFLLAQKAFQEKFPSAELKRTLDIFFRRFFTQQFKRSCIPDGPKVGSISLSPRADWRMPSDASYQLWKEELEKLQAN